MRKLKTRDLYTRVEQPAPARVLIPFTRVDQKLQFVIDCLRAQQIQPELALVDAGDAYWTLLRDAWSEGETFYVVEQDVAVWMGAIQQMEECEYPWCSLPTMCHGRMIPTTFGCVKFSAELIEKNPDFWEDIPTRWYHLDANFADKMGWPWIRPHVHSPPATHLNEIQWPDEISVRFAIERKMVWQAHEEGQSVARYRFYTPEDRRTRWWRRRKSEHVGVARVEE